MRLRNNPKAYDIMKENKSFVILEPENCKNKWKDIFGNNHPIYILKSGWVKVILFMKMLVNFQK